MLDFIIYFSFSNTKLIFIFNLNFIFKQFRFENIKENCLRKKLNPRTFKQHLMSLPLGQHTLVTDNSHV